MAADAVDTVAVDAVDVVHWTRYGQDSRCASSGAAV